MVLSELHIPLLSVWERLLKVFKSPGQHQHDATSTKHQGWGGDGKGWVGVRRCGVGRRRGLSG